MMSRPSTAPRIARPIATLAVIASLLVAACSAPVISDTDLAPPPPDAASTSTSPTTVPLVPIAQQNTELSPLARLVTPLGSARFDPADHVDAAPVPVLLSIPRLKITDTRIDAVGVAENGDMEIPGIDSVGWYRFGAKPGQEGSAVLAAHISYDGSPGVFRYLDTTQVGDLIEIEYDDGTKQVFTIVERAQYDKTDLPLERVFSKRGSPLLTLITCGGQFNRSLRSYEDNIVAYAIPIDR